LDLSAWGLGVQYWGFGVPMASFIYHNFMKTVPAEIDESATKGGASTFRIFRSIIFPMISTGCPADPNVASDKSIATASTRLAHFLVVILPPLPVFVKAAQPTQSGGEFRCRARSRSAGNPSGYAFVWTA
jgi:hypothetical protein